MFLLNSFNTKFKSLQHKIKNKTNFYFRNNKE